MFKVPHSYRERNHPKLGSDDRHGNNGFFIIPHYRIFNYEIRIQASDGMGWEHVSVSVADKRKDAKRCPTWEEMCWVKDLFWSEQDVVIQYHPAKSEYVSQHPFVLHLWRPVGVTLPTPDKIMVGINPT